MLRLRIRNTFFEAVTVAIIICANHENGYAHWRRDLRRTQTVQLPSEYQLIFPALYSERSERTPHKSKVLRPSIPKRF